MRLSDANQTTLVLDATVFYQLRNKVQAHVKAHSRARPPPQDFRCPWSRCSSCGSGRAREAAKLAL